MKKLSSLATQRFWNSLRNGNTSLVSCDLDNGMDINVPDRATGLTPLGYAILTNRKEMMALLVEKEADIENVGRGWKTADMLAQRNGADFHDAFRQALHRRDAGLLEKERARAVAKENYRLEMEESCRMIVRKNMRIIPPPLRKQR